MGPQEKHAILSDLTKQIRCLPSAPNAGSVRLGHIWPTCSLVSKRPQGELRHIWSKTWPQRPALLTHGLVKTRFKTMCYIPRNVQGRPWQGQATVERKLLLLLPEPVTIHLSTQVSESAGTRQVTGSTHHSLQLIWCCLHIVVVSTSRFVEILLEPSA